MSTAVRKLFVVLILLGLIGALGASQEINSESSPVPGWVVVQRDLSGDDTRAIQSAIDQAKLNDELRQVSHGQSVMPEEVLANPQLDVAVYALSHGELGGDLCELIPIDEHRTVVALGDASGHSIPATLVMSAVRGCVRSLSTNDLAGVNDTATIVRQINVALHGMTASHLFMSLLYGVLNTKTGTFTYTNAGHPTPVLFHGGDIRLLESHGLLLGVVPDADYKQSVVHLSPSDLLIAYTDGITEARSRVKKMFRSDGLISAVDVQHATSAQQVLHDILSGFDDHTAGNEQDDDRTLLVVRVPLAS